jgi:selenocysteine lyase/cysteine desulfurase
MGRYDLDEIRRDMIGRDLAFATPFGDRHLFYADYTASGRGVKRIEEQILHILESYANTHTEDDYSGKYMTTLLHQAESRIKELVNAGPQGKIIATGSGTTGALKKLQEIIGVYIPPLTRERIFQSLKKTEGGCTLALEKIEQDRPIVFIGPYEHHTNELMWREAFAEVSVVGFDEMGKISLRELDRRLADPRHANRLKLGSFSAGSNITGVKTDVYEIAQICHDHGALAFFDFAAVAPYVEIDMNRDERSYLDAIFFSPHKFLGGPGTSGILIFNEKIYRTDLPPTTAGGGTVSYVGFDTHDFSSDIEMREKAGTPPILQTIKAALAMELKEQIGVELIERLETQFAEYFIRELRTVENVDMIGDTAISDRIPIVSFNIRHRDRILHPKLVTKLMNDLFGIQSRAGCSCAGPYGHFLLGIDRETSQNFRREILCGRDGLKPGWVRVNLHYTMTQEDLDFLLQAIRFLARSAHQFLRCYGFNMQTGEWLHLDFHEPVPDFSLNHHFRKTKIDPDRLPELRRSYLGQAEALAADLEREGQITFLEDDPKLEALKVFYYAHRTLDSPRPS